MRKIFVGLIVFIIIWFVGINYVFSQSSPWKFISVYAADKETDEEINKRLGKVGISFSLSTMMFSDNAPDIYPISFGLWLNKFNPLLINLGVGLGVSSAGNSSLVTDGNLYFDMYNGHIFLGFGGYHNIMRFTEGNSIGELVFGGKMSILILDYLHEGLGITAYFLSGKYYNHTDYVYPNGDIKTKEDKKGVLGGGFGVMWLFK